MAAKKEKPEISPLDFKLAFQLICRNPALSKAEREVLFFILDRTYGWGKIEEYITLRHFTEGFFDRNGKCWCAKVGSPTTVEKAIRSLEQKGLIHRHKSVIPKGFVWIFRLETTALERNKENSDAVTVAQEKSNVREDPGFSGLLEAPWRKSNFKNERGLATLETARQDGGKN